MTRATAYSGTPFNLYEITYGENPENTFFYTNADDNIDYESQAFGANTYSAIAIQHDKIKQADRPKDNEIRITVSRKSTLAEHMRGTPPRRVLRVRILEGELVDGLPQVVIPIWHGRINGAEPKGSNVIFSCAPAGSRMQMPALTRTYSRQCSVALFSEACGANKALATEASTVAALPGINVVTLASGWQGLFTQENFLGGMLEWDTDLGEEVRAIVNVDGDTLVVDGPLTNLEVADNVRTVIGCPRTLEACRDLHNNINNYGGCPYIPEQNIFNKSMI